ncbi:inositol monophosphatase family protein [Patescibacteria group bacterium]
MDKRLIVAKKVILKAGDYLNNRFYKKHSQLRKKDNTTLLEEDLKSEEILMGGIHKYFPSDSFFSEETETEIKSDFVWVIDPLCGTYSYLRGVETWSLSVALVENNEYLLGVVYQPVLGNLFYAQIGSGAYKNNEQIHVSKVKNLSESFISFEHAVFGSGKINTQRLISDIKRIRVGHGTGSELSYVAAGHLDAVIKTDQELMHFAGGRVILEAAGGAFINFQGNNVRTFLDRNKKVNYIATNKHLQRKLLEYCLL